MTQEFTSVEYPRDYLFKQLDQLITTERTEILILSHIQNLYNNHGKASTVRKIF